MTSEEMVSYLRHNVSIQNVAGQADPNYLNMTDEDLSLYIKAAISRVMPFLSDMSLIPPDFQYLIILYAKKELYYALATSTAPFVDLGADSAFLKLGTRYDHYLLLIREVNAEIKEAEESGIGGAGGNTLTSYNVLLASKPYSRSSFLNSVRPAVYPSKDSVTSTTASISWNVITPFDIISYRVYAATVSVYDPYVDPSSIEALVPLTTIVDPRQRSCRLESLSPATTYYIVVGAQNIHGVTGYAQIAITTAVS